MTEELKEIIEEDFGIYPSQETIKKINELMEKHKEDTEMKEIIFAEISLMNDIITYGNQISNIWKHYLKSNNFLSPLREENKEWKTENIDYYKKRYAESKSPFIKSRYAFVILTLLKGKDRFDFSRECFDSWMNSLDYIYKDIKFKREDYSLNFELLAICVAFNIKLIISLDMKEKVDAIINFIKEFLKEESNELLRLEVLEEISVSLKELEKYSQKEINEIKESIGNFCESQIEFYKKRNLFPTVERYSRLLSTIKPEYNTEVIIAKSFEQDAESKTEPLIKCHLLESAIKEYQKLQSKYPDKKEEITVKIEELKLKILEESKKIKYKEFGYEIQIKKEDIDKRISYYKSQGDLFEIFFKTDEFIPNIKDVMNQVGSIKKDNPLSFMISHSVNSRFGPIVKYSTEEEILEFKYRRHYSLGIQISSAFLNLVWQRIEEELKEDFYQKISSLFEQEELSEIKVFLIKSISHFRNKDYISSIHLLMPYLEEIIRTIIRKVGATDNVLKTEKEKFFRKIEFGALISNEATRAIINDNLLETLNIFLLSEDQFNLRNLLCHGIISDKECNQHNNVYLIYLTLKLVYLLKNIREIKKENGSEK
ncbi:MAG: DUF4209 domain-containing protein [Candidatus Pacearchaeota archaeon]|nr:DUF4209 domain-containing protein [Candidatus Pacearchaeota archaeon]